MQHLGDITLIHGGDVPPVDCIIGGSPCQDLSIAGNRAGLAGARSGLFMEQIRIIKEMRKNYGTAYPRFMVWENVPGALSSNRGRDFAAVIEETVRVAEPEAPAVSVPEKGWPTAGCIYDDMGGWSVAWRIHDAQFWGVPQRRRRISLVADFGGIAAPEVLFIRKGVSRDPAPGPAARETPAGDASAGFGETGIGYWQPGIQCLRAEGANRPSSPGNVVLEPNHYYVFKGGNGAKAGLGLSEDTAPTLTAAGSGTNQAPTICIQGNCIDRADTAGCNGRGWCEDVCYTLNTVDRPAVFDARGGGDGKTTPTLAGDHEGRVTDYTALVMGFQGFGDYKPCEVGKSILASDDVSTSDLVVDVPQESVMLASGKDCEAFSGDYYILQGLRNKTVRRLTPLECERLQGYPDGWTDIGTYGNTAGKLRQSSDNARYTALGNSIALPFWKWLIKRIGAVYERDATMASLFDGIGGFPYLWEQVNGRGSCLWASEVNEFAIAVTKKRIGY